MGGGLLSTGRIFGGLDLRGLPSGLKVALVEHVIPADSTASFNVTSPGFGEVKGVMVDACDPVGWYNPRTTDLTLSRGYYDGTRQRVVAIGGSSQVGASRRATDIALNWDGDTNFQQVRATGLITDGVSFSIINSHYHALYMSVLLIGGEGISCYAGGFTHPNTTTLDVVTGFPVNAAFMTNTLSNATEDGSRIYPGRLANGFFAHDDIEDTPAGYSQFQSLATPGGQWDVQGRSGSWAAPYLSSIIKIPTGFQVETLSNQTSYRTNFLAIGGCRAAVYGGLHPVVSAMQGANYDDVPDPTRLWTPKLVSVGHSHLLDSNTETAGRSSAMGYTNMTADKVISMSTYGKDYELGSPWDEKRTWASNTKMRAYKGDNQSLMQEMTPIGMIPGGYRGYYDVAANTGQVMRNTLMLG